MGPASAQSSGNLNLWYDKPAAGWNEALPIGNGRLAAMVFGGVNQGQIQLNEGTIWAGEPGNNVPKKPVYGALQQMRKLLFTGKYLQAQLLSNQTFPRYAAKDNNYGMPYQTAGNLFIDFQNPGKITRYRRELDISRAIATVSYRVNGVNYKREVFASIPDNVIIVRLTADKPASISCNLKLKCPFKKYLVQTNKGKLSLSAVTGSVDNKTGKVRYQVEVFPKTEGGVLTATDSTLEIAKADTATLYISIATNFVSYKDISGDPGKKASQYLKKALKKSYAEAKRAQINAYRKYFDRVSLDLGRTRAAKKPTDVRVAEYGSERDPGLAALYFQFGRYLLISSSFPGSQPANLQGKWNAEVHPPWDSKYTVNINTEMNYWPAEIAALPEMHEPLFEMLKDLSQTGKESASHMYHARGWNLHHNTDLWRITGIVDGGYYGIWPMGGAWLSQQLWQHYVYTGDTGFLKQYYPVLKGAAMFYVDVLQVEPSHHWLVVSPSMSPEHSHMKKDGVSIDITYGTTMDNQLVFDLFSHTIAAAKILGRDAKFADTLRMKKDSLPPMQIGQYGQLQEWIKDWDKPHDHHRHESHLYGLFPSNQISAFRTPELFKAARNSLIQRGDESTEWSMAWKINLWDRLLDGDHAMRLLKDILTPPQKNKSGTYPNLFAAYPPFQIDGNFGATAGIAHMLLQSDEGRLFVLPALPGTWKRGEVKGLRGRGGFIVDMVWEGGKLSKLVVHSTLGGACRIRTYSKVKAAGDFSLDTASLANAFFSVPEIKKPLISPKAHLSGVKVKKTYLYSFTTEPGKSYVLKSL
jgi:alpha-L-fucosidase 2